MGSDREDRDSRSLAHTQTLWPPQSVSSHPDIRPHFTTPPPNPGKPLAQPIEGRMPKLFHHCRWASEPFGAAQSVQRPLRGVLPRAFASWPVLWPGLRCGDRTRRRGGSAAQCSVLAHPLLVHLTLRRVAGSDFVGAEGMAPCAVAPYTRCPSKAQSMSEAGRPPRDRAFFLLGGCPLGDEPLRRRLQPTAVSGCWLLRPCTAPAQRRGPPYSGERLRTPAPAFSRGPDRTPALRYGARGSISVPPGPGLSTG